MSDAKNSSSGSPGRSSQAGFHPAPGASRVGGASSVVDRKAEDTRAAGDEGLKATAAVLKLDKTSHFMMVLIVINRIDRINGCAQGAGAKKGCSFFLLFSLNDRDYPFIGSFHLKLF